MIGKECLLFVCAASTHLTLATAKGTEMGEYYFRDQRFQNKIPSAGELTIASNTTHISEYQCGMFCKMFPGCLAFTVYNGICAGYDALFTDKTFDAAKFKEGVQYYELSGIMQNIAFGKPTGASSYYNHFGTLLNGQFAVNGGRGGLELGGEVLCFHSEFVGEEYMWLDLQERYFITIMKIVNRPFSWDRFHNVSVSVGDTLETLNECWFFTGPPETAYVFVFRCGKAGRFVKVQKHAVGTLVFCGLEISGYPVQ